RRSVHRSTKGPRRRKRGRSDLHGLAAATRERNWNTMVAFGTCAILFATLAAVWAAVCSFLGGATGSTGFVRSGRRAVYAAGFLFTAAVVSLEYLILTNDFSVQYVFQN